MGTGEDCRLQAPRTEPGQSARSPEPTGAPLEGGSRCCVPSCDCAAFTPSPGSGGRFCCACGHGWLPHAAVPATATVEEVAGAVLAGRQALTIRLKILLDRLLSALTREEALHLLAGFGWTLEDYARGYMLQDKYGKMLQRWQICSDEEEPLVLRRFLGFPETRGLALKLMQPSTGPRSECGSSSENLCAPPFSGDLPVPVNGATYERRPTAQVLSPPPAAAACRAALPGPHASPLYQLQNMQPLDFCKVDRANGERLPLHAVQDEPGLINLSMPKLAEAPKWYREDADHARTSYATSSPSLSRPSPPTSVFSEADKTSRGSSCLADSGDEDDDVENFQSAMNLSRDSSNGARHATEEDHKRLPPSSPKRKWGGSLLDLPFNLATPVVNQVTGKKRVQCNVCLKTFCDKGALKIHFSAVHLREMHKCTVEGCNMMFSSRRSRNRHSANPNPKLHSSGVKRRPPAQEARPAHLQALSLVAASAAAAASPPTTANGGYPAALDSPPTPEACVDLSTHKYEEKTEESWYHNTEAPLDSIHLRSFTNGIVIKAERSDETYGDYDKENDNSPLQYDFSRHLSQSYVDNQKSPQNSQEENHGKEERSDVKVVWRSENTQEENNYKQELSDVRTMSVIEEVRRADSQLPLRGVRKRKSRNPTRYGSCPKRTHLLSLDSVASVSGSNECLGDATVDGAFDAGRPDQQISVAVDMQNEEGAVVVEENDGVPDGDVLDTKAVPCSRQLEESAINQEDCVEENCETSVRGVDDNTCPVSCSESVSNMKSDEIVSEGEHVPVDSNIAAKTETEGCTIKEGEGTSDSDANTAVEEETCKDDGLNVQGLEDTPNQSEGQTSTGDSVSSQNESSESSEEHRGAPSREIPIDQENPRRCVECGKVFLNHFCVKTHFRNVHLRLQHACTVAGCAAAFPSKRSRDRHSANHNLHRHLQPAPLRAEPTAAQQ